MLNALILAVSLSISGSAGHWSGFMQRGSARLSVTFDFPKGTAASGFFSAPDLGAIDVPLKNVRLGSTLRWELAGDTTTTVFDGRAEDNTMSGRFDSDSSQKPYDAREVSFENGPVRLAGTLYVPRTPGKHAAVIFVHGSGAEGRWASAYLANFVARRGIVALAYDKRGVGSSTGDWRNSTMQDFAADARAGVNLLAHVPQVDARRIGVYGHSQGGEIAPAIAANNPQVAWVIDADGPVVPQYLQDLFRVDTALAHRYSGKELSDAEQLYAEFVDVARSGSPHGKLRSDVAASANAPWLDDLAIPGDASWIWAWYAKYGNYDNTARGRRFACRY